MPTRIILVRHGQTDWNRIERYRGRSDISLDATGIAQAKKTAKRIASSWNPVAVYSSPLSRAMQTAEFIAQSCKLFAQVSNELVDIHMGEWQGLTPEEVHGRWPDLFDNWINHPEKAKIPGGETLSQVRKRALQALKDICWLHSDRDVVLISHSGVNRLILLKVLGLQIDRFWHLYQDPCSINVFETNGKDHTLISMNDTGHLTG